jgi:PAS domain S-box-containing protein
MTERDSQPAAYAEIFQRIDDGLCEIEVLFGADGRAEDYRFIAVNAAFERHTGLQDAIGRRMRELAPAHEDHWFELYGEVARTRRPMTFERAAQALGERCFQVHAFPVGAPEQHRVAVHFTDVSATRRTEQALQASEARFRHMANASPTIQWIAAADGRTEYFSERWYAYTGMAVDAENSMIREHLHPDEVAAISADWQQALVEKSTYARELRLRRHDGVYRWFLVRAEPTLDADGRITAWYGAAIDIEERRQAEDALRRYGEAMHQAGQRKDEFIAMLAHELRNPLAPISAAADVLRMIAGGDPRVERATLIIARQVRHLRDLLHDLLDVSRVTRGVITLELEPVDLKRVLAGAIEQVRPTLEERQHRLDLQLPAEPAWVQGDAKRLTQVVVNLLSNAVKYTPSGGCLRVAIEASGTQATIVVEDNGIGMEAELIERVFEPFSQGRRSPDRSEGGLGIGLALVRSLVELHHGQARASSAGVGHGSRFCVELPLLDAAVIADAASTATPVPVADGEGLELLVVDDNVDAACLLGMLCEMLGHRVTVSHHGRDALQRAATQRYDVVLLDIGLPGLDGYEVARQLRLLDHRRRPLIVAVSGYGQAEDRRRALEAGFDAHLVKPVDADTLAELLTTAGAADP